MSPVSAFIGDAVVPRLGVVTIEETGVGYFITGTVQEETEKREVLFNLGRIQKGKIEHAKFVTKHGALVNETFKISELKFGEDFMSQSSLTYTIQLQRRSRMEENRAL